MPCDGAWESERERERGRERERERETETSDVSRWADAFLAFRGPLLVFADGLWWLLLLVVGAFEHVV